MTRRRLWRPLSLAALALAALTGCDLGAEEIQQDVEQGAEEVQQDLEQGAEDVQQGAEEGIAEVEQGLEDVQDAGGEDEGGQDG
ncbi:hypothetical protein BJF77_04740 [Kocuria sp. CNJ-770]|uniref:Uncharacterized protein n=1 Tax=Kocuria oceani TaxID=988827 RepID=A0ABV9TES2_9MICC|nr:MULTISPECIES: hypothetical protein [Kocuria]OLT04137.1 hypothetical protein BJF77_04740 [Kocuria sp. CNJ-770]